MKHFGDMAIEYDYEAEARRLVKAVKESDIDENRLIFAIMEELAVFIKYGAKDDSRNLRA
jgi:hypothetical protein